MIRPAPMNLELDELTPAAAAFNVTADPDSAYAIPKRTTITPIPMPALTSALGVLIACMIGKMIADPIAMMNNA
jgi:hypothetical protein